MIKGKNKIIILNIASAVILQGLAFFSGPIFSAALGRENYGIASVYLTWVQLASTVFSLQAAGTFAFARVSFPMTEQEQYQSSTLSLSTISFAVFSAVTILCASVAARWLNVSMPMVCCGLAHAWGLYCVGAMNGKFTYEFDAGKNFILSVATSSLTILASLALLRVFPPETNYWSRILGQTAVYAAIGVFLFVYMLRAGGVVYHPEYWRFTLPLSIPTIFHLLANIVLNQSDRVMLQSLVGNSAAGVYALACTFGTVLNTIWFALNRSWAPFYYEYTRQDKTEEMMEHAKNYMELFTVVAVGFILLSREVFHVYAAESFWEGADLIPLFSVGYYCIFLYSFPVNYEFYHKRTKTIAVGTGAAAVCNVVLNYFFIRAWGIQGAVVATAISHGFQFAFHFLRAGRIEPGQFPFRIRQFVPGFAAVCGACVLYWRTRHLWPLRWGLGVILGAFLLARIIRRKEIF